MRLVRLVAVIWWLNLKMRSRAAFDGFMNVIWPLFFSTTVFLMFRAGNGESAALLAAAVGASVMGIWSSTSTTAASALQQERRQGTLELLVAAPAPFGLVVLPVTLSMATIGLYSMAVTLLFGRFVFGIDIVVRNLPAFALAVTVTVVAIGVLGFLLAVSSVRYRTAWALGSTLELPVWLICGFLVPVATLPGWVRPISWLLAPTWGMAAIRAAAEGRSPTLDIAVCLALAVVYAWGASVLSRHLVDSARVHATLALS